MSALVSEFAMELGGETTGDVVIVNQSRGTVPPFSAPPTGVKSADPVRFSVRHLSSVASLTDLQALISFAQLHAKGTSYFQFLLPRTSLTTLNPTDIFDTNPDFSIVSGSVQISKTAPEAQRSVYVTSQDAPSGTPVSALVSVTIQPTNNPEYDGGETDPMGPVFGLEYGPRQTAAYVFLLTTPAGDKVLRLCGPRVGTVRQADLLIPFDWDANIEYVLLWNETLQEVRLYQGGGSGDISNTALLASLPISDFQSFGPVGSQRVGGAGDISAIYGVEGNVNNAARFQAISLSTDVGYPFNNGARLGSFVTTLASDEQMGFSGRVDPTRGGAIGAWFDWETDKDPSGRLLPSPGGYCRLIKATPGTTKAICRAEPGFFRTGTGGEGLMLELKFNAVCSGGVAQETDAALVISDGVTVYTFTFFDTGAVRNIGLLRRDGDYLSPSGHYLPTSPIDWRLRRLRYVVNPQRRVVEIYDATELRTPLVSWSLDLLLPLATSSDELSGLLCVGLVNAGDAVGTFDIYDIKYTYMFRSWESSDDIFPMEADPPFTESGGITEEGPLNLSLMPGVVPMSYANGVGSGEGIATLSDDGLKVVTLGGETLYYSQVGPVSESHGAALEVCVRVESWHPSKRTGALFIIDDSNHSFILSFIETDAGKYVAIPLSSGLSGFQEIVGDVGLGAKLSHKIDWTVFHTYRLERRPLDGVYLFIDNDPTPVLVLPDSARYSFPASQLHAQAIAFGQISDEGATSVWRYVRDVYGSGFEVSTRPNVTYTELQKKLSDSRTLILVSAGS